ncbi:MAG: TRAP transporter large permease subunit, partial [Thermoleophilia bacterium]|nr:TRAP transporter large permease subunit [Thermoleophilia bacterium]
IFYGIFTGVSIGELFIAGIVPGVVLSSGFMITIYGWCRLRPELAGISEEKFTWKEKFGSFKTSGPIALLFLLVMGGIYFGIFTTTEGGGIGAFLALVIAVAMRRVNLKSFWSALFEAAKTNAIMIFMVLGSMIMGRVLTVGGLGDMLSGFLGGLPPSLVGVVILMFYFVIGFFVDTITVLILTMPILTPILKGVGIDMLWFGVVLVMVINIGAYTPPYGLNNFILASSTDLKLGTIWRGVWPFAVCNIAVVVLLFLVPDMVNWLPRLLK